MVRRTKHLLGRAPVVLAAEELAPVPDPDLGPSGPADRPHFARVRGAVRPSLEARRHRGSRDVSTAGRNHGATPPCLRPAAMAREAAS